MKLINEINDYLVVQKRQSSPDHYSQMWLVDGFKEEIKAHFNENLASLKTDRRLRDIYARKVFGFVKCYITCVLIIFFGYQFILVPLKSDVPIYPIITLLGTTSVTVIGLLATVLRYLFHNNLKK